MRQVQTPAKTAKLFSNGASQAVRLPQEFRFEGSEVYIWRDERAGTVVLSKQRPVSWDEFCQLRAQLADEELQQFMADRVQPSAQVRSPFLNED
jgi:antitoxin VapB